MTKIRWILQFCMEKNLKNETRIFKCKFSFETHPRLLTKKRE